jgi:hypothetical protein
MIDHVHVLSVHYSGNQLTIQDKLEIKRLGPYQPNASSVLPIKRADSIVNSLHSCHGTFECITVGTVLFLVCVVWQKGRCVLKHGFGLSERIPKHAGASAHIEKSINLQVLGTVSIAARTFFSKSCETEW